VKWQPQPLPLACLRLPRCGSPPRRSGRQFEIRPPSPLDFRWSCYSSCSRLRRPRSCSSQMEALAAPAFSRSPIHPTAKRAEHGEWQVITSATARSGRAGAVWSSDRLHAAGDRQVVYSAGKTGAGRAPAARSTRSSDRDPIDADGRRTHSWQYPAPQINEATESAHKRAATAKNYKTQSTSHHRASREALPRACASRFRSRSVSGYADREERTQNVNEACNGRDAGPS
jgi:hypothetical protein